MYGNPLVTHDIICYYLADLGKDTDAATHMILFLGMKAERINKLPLELKQKRENILKMLSSVATFKDFKKFVRATSADVSEVMKFNNEEESNDSKQCNNKG